MSKNLFNGYFLSILTIKLENFVFCYSLQEINGIIVMYYHYNDIVYIINL